MTDLFDAPQRNSGGPAAEAVDSTSRRSSADHVETATLPNPGGTRGAHPPKLFKIGEVMRYSRLSRQTVHNYTMMGLIEEVERTESGHRLYPENVFALIERIELLKRHRSLREVRDLLEAERTAR